MLTTLVFTLKIGSFFWKLNKNVVTIGELPGGGFVLCDFSGRNRFLKKNVFESMFKDFTVNKFLGLVNIGFNK